MSSNSKEENQEKSLLESFKDFLKEHWGKILSACLGILFAIFFIDTKDIKNKFTTIVILILLSFLLYRFSNFTIYHVSNHHININLIDSFIFLLLIRTVFYSFNSNKIKQYFLHNNTTIIYIENLFILSLIIYLIYELSTNTLNTIINNLKLIHIIIIIMLIFFIVNKWKQIKEFFNNDGYTQVNYLFTYIIFTFLLYFTKDLKLNTIFSNYKDIKLICLFCIIILFGLFCKFIIKRFGNLIYYLIYYLIYNISGGNITYDNSN